jgi:hypothetical protein
VTPTMIRIHVQRSKNADFRSPLETHFGCRPISVFIFENQFCNSGHLIWSFVPRRKWWWTASKNVRSAYLVSNSYWLPLFCEVFVCFWHCLTVDRGVFRTDGEPCTMLGREPQQGDRTEQQFPACVRQYSRSWFRAPSGPMNTFLFLLRPLT